MEGRILHAYTTVYPFSPDGEMRRARVIFSRVLCEVFVLFTLDLACSRVS